MVTGLQELTLSYIDMSDLEMLQDVDKRRAHLRETYCFECECVLCCTQLENK